MHHTKLIRRALLGLLALAPLAAAGCGDPDAPEISRVTGTVTRGGNPVPNLTVNFMPTEGRPSWGITDAQGRYELEYNADYKGAKVGQHKVYVVMAPTTMGGGIEGISPEDQRAIFEKYGNEENSPLVVTVESKRSQVIDLQLD